MKRIDRIRVLLLILFALLGFEGLSAQEILKKELLSSSTNNGITTFKWVVKYNPKEHNSSGKITLDDSFSPNQSYVNGSEVHPNGWSISQNASGFTWEITNGAYYSKNFPKYSGVITVPGTGDGYKPIPYTAANGDSRVYFLNHHQSPGDTLFNCVGACPTTSTWPKKLPDGDPNTNTYTGTTQGPKTVIVNRKLYYAVTKPSSSGIGCYDLESDSECGYLQLSNTGGTVMKKMDGPFSVGGNVIMIDSSMKAYKVSISGNSMSLINSYDMSTTGLSAQTNIYVGGKAVNSNLCLVTSSKIGCLDTAAMGQCSGWSSAKNANSSYAAASYIYYNSAMSPIAICVKSGSTQQCLDINNGSTLTLADAFPGVNEVGEGFTLGSKTFTPHVFTNKVSCYDWSSSSTCTPAIINGPSSAKVYATTYDKKGCAWVYGHNSKLWSFNPDNGETPCGGKTMVLEDTYDASKNWCATKQVRWNYNSLTINGINSSDFSDLNITFYDANGNVIKQATIPTNTSIYTENLAIAPFLPNQAIHYKIEGTWSSTANPNNPSPTVAIDISAPPLEFCFNTETKCPISGEIKNSVVGSANDTPFANYDVVKEADGLCQSAQEEPEVKPCLAVKPKLSCKNGELVLELENMKPSSFANEGETSISVIAPDSVHLTPFNKKWYIQGAQAGDTINLFINSALEGMGKKPGNDLCCAANIEITIPKEKSCKPPKKKPTLDLNKTYNASKKQFDITVHIDGNIKAPNALIVHDTLPEGVTLTGLATPSDVNWTCTNSFPISGSDEIDCIFTGASSISRDAHLTFNSSIDASQMPQTNCAQALVSAIDETILPSNGNNTDCATVPHENNSTENNSSDTNTTAPFNISSAKEFVNCDTNGICTFKLTFTNDSNQSYNGPITISEHTGGATTNYSIASLTPAGICPTEPTSVPFQCVQNMSFAPNETKVFTIKINAPLGSRNENCINSFNPPPSMGVGNYNNEELSQALQNANLIHPDHLSGNCVNFSTDKPEDKPEDNTSDNTSDNTGCNTDSNCSDNQHCQESTGLCLSNTPDSIPNPGVGIIANPRPGGSSTTGSSNTPTKNPKLDIKKTAPANCVAGRVCTYTIRVYNRGDAFYNAPLRIADSKSSQVGVFQSSAPSQWICTTSANIVNCLLPHAVIAPGTYKELRLSFRTKVHKKTVIATNCASIKRKSTGSENITAIQKRLRAVGYKSVRVSGKLDKRTSKAIERYRKKRHLSKKAAIKRLASSASFSKIKSCVKVRIKPKYETRPACKQGTHWDSHLKRCIPDIKICPKGTYLDRKLNRCIPKITSEKICKKGTHFDKRLKRCIPNRIIRPKCSKGQHWNDRIRHCVSDIALPPKCKKGTYWNAQFKRCLPVRKVCPKGQHWDDRVRHCVTNRVIPPKCQKGTYWNPRVKRCLPKRDIRPKCPKGQHWNERVRHCVSNIALPPKCKKGMYWNAQFKKCLPKRVIRLKCPKGSFYNSRLKRCIQKPIAKPICPRGTHFDKARKRCIKNIVATPRCKAGTVWNQRVKRCIKHTVSKPAIRHICPRGTYYNKERKRCIPAAKP